MSLIEPDNSFLILFVLLLAVAIGVIGEERGWFKMISGALVTIIVGVFLTTFRILPNGSDPGLTVPTYDFAFTYLVPFSIPLLLFNVELKKIFLESGRLMTVFLIGSLGVAVGATIASLIIDLGPSTFKLAAVYTATYTGGSVNFIAVADSFEFLEDDLFAASIVVDNVITIIYILILFYLPKFKSVKRLFTEENTPYSENPEKVPDLKEMSLLSQTSLSLLITGAIVALAKIISPWLAGVLQIDINLEMLFITLFIIILVNIIPGFFKKLEKVAFDLGMYMLYFFLAIIGATCDLTALVGASLDVLFFACIILLVHLVFLLTAGRIMGFSIKEIAIASGANVGGSSVSAPMAATFSMKSAVTAAVLIGIMGNVIGTFIGISMGLLLR